MRRLSLTQLPEWRGYVRGFDARATFPHRITVRQLAETVAELQRTEFMERMARKRLQFKGQPFIGLQLDMWTDTDTHTAFAAISGTMVEEPMPSMQPQRLWLLTQLNTVSHKTTKELSRVSFDYVCRARDREACVLYITSNIYG